MQRTNSFLGGLTEREFLSRYWQKEPLLVRGAVPNYEPPLGPEELLGLALEDEVESRLVRQQGGTFHLERGPFEEDRFASLPESHWTLLVQDLDQHVQAVGDLFELLDFLPSYRLDDVMASVAVPFGSVGPHYDQYDVFLLQVHGRRRWQIARHFDRSDVRTDTELCILNEFTPELEWVLDPGDMLYLPPSVAHFGIAVDECVTYSLGCRAPSISDLIGHFAERAMTAQSEDRRYADPDLAQVADRSSLDEAAITRVRHLLDEHLHFGQEQTARGLGALFTEPKALFSREGTPALSAKQVKRALRAKVFERAKGSRWLRYTAEKASYLFVDGVEYCLDPAALDVARALCERRVFDGAWLRACAANANAAKVIEGLLAAQVLVPRFDE